MKEGSETNPFVYLSDFIVDVENWIIFQGKNKKYRFVAVIARKILDE